MKQFKISKTGTVFVVVFILIILNFERIAASCSDFLCEIVKFIPSLPWIYLSQYLADYFPDSIFQNFELFKYIFEILNAYLLYLLGGYLSGYYDSKK